MNSSTTITALFLFFLLPGVLFGVLWYISVKRGWGSRGLLASSITVLISFVVIVLWWSVREPSILVFGLGFAVLCGIAFFVFRKTTPFSNALMGQNQQMQIEWESLSEEEKTARKQSVRIAIREILVARLIQYIPLIICVFILLVARGAPSKVITSLIAFIFGFTGILRIVLRPKHPAFQLYAPKSRVVGDILTTVLAWGLALYNLLAG